MPRFSTDILYGLGVASVGLLALWVPPFALVLAGAVLGLVLHIMRRRRDKSSVAVRTARRPLVEALWAHSGDDADPGRLTSAVGRLLRDESLADAVVLVAYETGTDQLSGHLSHAGGIAPVSLAVAGANGLLGATLRMGRPLTSDASGQPVEAALGAGVAEDSAWVALPLLDPAPLAACLDGGHLHAESCAWREPSGSDEGSSWRGACAGCVHDPVRGLLALHLTGDNSPDDLAEFLEGLARTLGTMLSMRRLGRRLEVVEAWREQLLDGLLNGLLSTDDEGRVRYMNRRARELFAGASVTGRRLDEIVRLPAGRTAVTRALMEGQATLRAEGLLQREGAEPSSLPVRVNLTPLRMPDNTINGAVCVIEDRSDVAQLENEIRHLDTLAALGRFASGLAHEIRNPLGGIQAGVEFLDHSNEFSGPVREHLSVIQGEVQRVDAILTDLLEVARPRELVAAPVDPVALCRSVLDGFAHLAESVEVRLSLDAPPSCEEICIDEQMIRQVLVNLVKNAIEASPQGAEVELMVLPLDPADASRARGGFVVADRGTGISEEDRAHLFEPFFTRKSKGTGLGLYVSHGFVERHGGRLKVTSRPGGGSSFRVDLPRVTALVGG
ncbi:hypothetical protein DRQ53_05125 [bacterium]|nr:MAG: hypothetical protein DRQ32_02140 [bacterium]RKZ16865.1 MAG: hypothetical protein DRQ53_05125 [bacterium]